jgi:hypothetical protein
MATRREQQLAAMDATALVAELRALSDAGSSYDDQALCRAGLCKVSPPPTGAAAEDAVRAIVVALTRGVEYAGLQYTGCYTLTKVLIAAPAAAGAAGGGVTAVVSALRAHPGEVSVQGAACAALAQLSIDKTCRATAGAAGCCAAVVAAMTRHPLDSHVLTLGCSALGKLTDGHSQNARAALDAGAVTVVLAAMRTFFADATMQFTCCYALSRIGYALGGFGGVRAEGSAADAAVAVMNAHAGDLMLQIECLHVLYAAFHGDRNADAEWVQRGAAALTAVTAVQHTYATVMDPLSLGCSVLTRLMMCTPNNTRAAGIGHTIKAVVAALRASPAAAKLQHAGCVALASMCQHVRDNKLAAVAAGALEVTISAMRTHTSNEDVQMAGCLALHALVAEVPPSQTRAGALGGVEVLVVALRECAVPLPAERVKHFQSWCRAMVWLLHHNPINKHKAVAAGCIELLVVHTCTPSADASMFGLACHVFGQLLGGTGHEVRAITAGALEALEARRAEDPDVESIRLQLVRDLQPAVRRHDAAPCVVAGCKRCAAARKSGVMCALPGCGARRRDGSTKKLLRCGTCRAVCYCGAAHQREDWGRHKGECGATAHDDDIEQAGGAS